MKKSIILCCILLAFSSLTVVKAAESEGNFKVKQITATETPMNTFDGSTLFVDENTKDKISKCYYDNHCNFTESYKYCTFNQPYINLHLDFNHIMHIYGYKHPSENLTIDDSNVVDYLDEQNAYIIPILDDNNNYAGIANFTYDSDKNTIDFLYSGNLARNATNCQNVLLGGLSLDTFVGEKVEKMYFVKISGCCIIYDTGIIYKTVSGYKYVSIQNNVYDDIPNSEIWSLQEFNKELIDINVDDMGNGVIDDKPDDKLENNPNDLKEHTATSTSQSNSSKPESSVNTEESNQTKAGDSTSFLCIISGIVALSGLTKSKLRK